MGVIPIDRDGVPFERKVDEGLVHMLEHTLELAKAGEVIGVQMTLTFYDGTANPGGGGLVTQSTLGAMTLNQREACRVLEDED